MLPSSCSVKEVIVGLLDELVKCNIYELRELKTTWLYALSNTVGIRQSTIAFCEKLIDTVIDQKEMRRLVDIRDIKTYLWFEETPPNPEKLERKERDFKKTGLLNQSEIILDGDGYLIDGYTTYLLSIKYRVGRVPVKYGKRQIIKAYHRPGGKLYAWELPKHLIDRVLPGDRVVVAANGGARCVTVEAVEDYGGVECARPLKKAVRKIKNRITETK